MNKEKVRFDPYHGSHSFDISTAAIELDNSKRSNHSRLDHVRELGELLEKNALEAKNNSDYEFGFYTIIDFRDAFQKPLEDYGYKLENHREAEPLRKDLLKGISEVADELTRFSYMPVEMKERTNNLIGFCISLSRKLSSIRESGIRYFAA